MKIKEVMTATELTEKTIHYYEYGFSIGTMLILVGVIPLVRASAMSEYYILTLGGADAGCGFPGRTSARCGPTG